MDPLQGQVADISKRPATIYLAGGRAEGLKVKHNYNRVSECLTRTRTKNGGSSASTTWSGIQKWSDGWETGMTASRLH